MVRWAFDDSTVGVQTEGTQQLEAVDIWPRDRLLTEIIFTRAASQWELSTAAVMLHRDQGFKGLLPHTVHSGYTLFFYSTRLGQSGPQIHQKCEELIHQSSCEMICIDKPVTNRIPQGRLSPAGGHCRVIWCEMLNLVKKQGEKAKSVGGEKGEKKRIVLCLLPLVLFLAHFEKSTFIYVLLLYIFLYYN